MTPSARFAAAIDILDAILAPNPVEKTLTNWGRSNRYAGSGDRAAIRDLVFEALRRRSSLAWIGGSDSGRGLMLGLARSQGLALDEIFSGEKYAPDTISADEKKVVGLKTAPRHVQLDCPEWLIDRFDADLGKDADAVLELLKSRAPVYLRVNQLNSNLDEVQEKLAAAEIETKPDDQAYGALEVLSNPRRVMQSEPYLQGLVEVQDAGSQAVIEGLPIAADSSILDYCAGGGGKALAMADKTGAKILAHDALPQRMVDLPKRADRAGADIEVVTGEQLKGRSFDLVLCDVPCSGSGSWRRTPEAKWALTPERLEELRALQTEILHNASALVAKGGTLAYVTCSLFGDENQVQVKEFQALHPEWKLTDERHFSLLEGGDGFYTALFTRA